MLSRYVEAEEKYIFDEQPPIEKLLIETSFKNNPSLKINIIQNEILKINEKIAKAG